MKQRMKIKDELITCIQTNNIFELKYNYDTSKLKKEEEVIKLVESNFKKTLVEKLLNFKQEVLTSKDNEFGINPNIIKLL